MISSNILRILRIFLRNRHFSEGFPPKSSECLWFSSEIDEEGFLLNAQNFAFLSSETCDFPATLRGMRMSSKILRISMVWEEHHPNSKKFLNTWRLSSEFGWFSSEIGGFSWNTKWFSGGKSSKARGRGTPTPSPPSRRNSSVCEENIVNSDENDPSLNETPWFGMKINRFRKKLLHVALKSCVFYENNMFWMTSGNHLNSDEFPPELRISRKILKQKQTFEYVQSKRMTFLMVLRKISKLLDFQSEAKTSSGFLQNHMNCVNFLRNLGFAGWFPPKILKFKWFYSEAKDVPSKTLQGIFSLETNDFLLHSQNNHAFVRDFPWIEWFPGGFSQIRRILKIALLRFLPNPPDYNDFPPKLRIFWRISSNIFQHLRILLQIGGFPGECLGGVRRDPPPGFCRSEGLPWTGYSIPGHDGTGYWRLGKIILGTASPHPAPPPPHPSHPRNSTCFFIDSNVRIPSRVSSKMEGGGYPPPSKTRFLFL